MGYLAKHLKGKHQRQARRIIVHAALAGATFAFHKAARTEFREGFKGFWTWDDERCEPDGIAHSGPFSTRGVAARNYMLHKGLKVPGVIL